MIKHALMDRSSLIISGVFLVAMLFSCSDIIEPDITDKQLIIISPVDKLISQSTSTTFFWDKLEGGRKYELQIVSPSFDSAARVAVDTLLVGNKFTKVLTVGDYQWRVRAINNGYKTSFSTRSFKIK